MKLLIVLFALISVETHASYMATHCSNSDASVRWEEGHNSNTMSLRYYDQTEQTKVIPLQSLNIQEADEHVIREERIHECGYSSYTKVYSAKVTITPTPDAQDVLDFISENKKIETEVICTRHLNGRAPCPVN